MLEGKNQFTALPAIAKNRSGTPPMWRALMTASANQSVIGFKRKRRAAAIAPGSSDEFYIWPTFGAKPARLIDHRAA
jgi:hypothetical protein